MKPSIRDAVWNHAAPLISSEYSVQYEITPLVRIVDVVAGKELPANLPVHGRVTVAGATEAIAALKVLTEIRTDFPNPAQFKVKIIDVTKVGAHRFGPMQREMSTAPSDQGWHRHPILKTLGFQRD